MRRDMVIRTVINGMIVEVGLYGYDSTSDVAEQVGEVSHRFAACTIGCVKFPMTVWSQRSPATEPRDMFPTTDTALNRCGDAARYTAASRVPAIRLPWIITPSAGRITARSRIPTKLGAPTLHERSFPDTVTSCTDSMSTPCPAVSLVSTLPEITRCAPAPPEWCTTRIAEPLTPRRRIVLLATTTRSATLLKSSTPFPTFSMAVSEFSCVGRAVDPVQAMARVKRSPKRMANCALAMHHSRPGMVHSFSDRFKTRNSSFRAASSVGK